MSTQIYNYGMKAESRPDLGTFTTTKHHKLGTYWDDGERRFRYAHLAHNGIRAARLMMPARSSGYQLIASANLQSVGGGYGDSAGNREIKVYSAVGLSANAFEDGYVTVHSGIGAGQSLRIDTYETGTAGKATKVTLEDPLRMKLSTTSVLTFRKNRHRECIESSGTQAILSMLPVGVTLHGSGTTSAVSGHGWLQTKGPGTIESHDAVVRSELLVPADSGGVSGVFNTDVSGTNLAIVGIADGAAAAGEYVSCDLWIEK